MNLEPLTVQVWPDMPAMPLTLFRALPPQDLDILVGVLMRDWRAPGGVDVDALVVELAQADPWSPWGFVRIGVDSLELRDALDGWLAAAVHHLAAAPVAPPQAPAPAPGLALPWQPVAPAPGFVSGQGTSSGFVLRGLAASSGLLRPRSL